MQSFKHFSYVMLVLQLVVREDQNIVQVSCVKVVQVIKQYIIYILLVYRQAISKSKQQNLIFIYSKLSLESGQFFRVQVYIDIVESLLDIKLSKHFSISNLGQGFINQRQQVLVLLYKEVKFPKVNIEVEGPVQLLSKKDQRRKQGLARLNKTLVQILNQVLLNNFKFLSRYIIQQVEL